MWIVYRLTTSRPDCNCANSPCSNNNTRKIMIICRRRHRQHDSISLCFMWLPNSGKQPWTSAHKCVWCVRASVWASEHSLNQTWNSPLWHRGPWSRVNRHNQWLHCCIRSTPLNWIWCVCESCVSSENSLCLNDSLAISIYHLDTQNRNRKCLQTNLD